MHLTYSLHTIASIINERRGQTGLLKRPYFIEFSQQIGCFCLITLFDGFFTRTGLHINLKLSNTGAVWTYTRPFAKWKSIEIFFRWLERASRERLTKLAVGSERVPQGAACGPRLFVISRNVRFVGTGAE